MATGNDWHNQIANSTWQERNNFLLNNKFMSDCSFVVTTENGDAVKIPAHKYVLGGNSWDFYNLFFLMEAGSNEIPIADFSVDVVKIFLELIYRASADLTMDNIWDVLKLVERFSVKSVKAFCCEFLAKQITSENVMELLTKATDNDLENLSANCILHMHENGINYFETEEFLEIENQAVVKILKSDELRGNELDLFKSVYRWATKSCEKNNQLVNLENIRLALGDVLKYIRFGAMTGNEFSECVTEYSILSPKETIQTFQFICDGKTHCEFSGNKRCGFGKKKFRIINIGPNDYNYMHQHSIEFTTDKQIVILGVMMYGFKDESKNDYWSIVLESNKNRLLSASFYEYMDGSKKIYNRLFREKVCLAPHTTYSIWFYGLHPWHHYYQDTRADFNNKDHVFDGVTFKFNVTEDTPFAGLIFE